jgi:glycosyltransferase involved in cell wall biosynthesis
MADSVRKAQLHFGDYVHPLYREQLHSVPGGWEYDFTHPSLTDQSAATKRVVDAAAPLAKLRDVAEPLALRALSFGGYVHRVPVKPLPGATIIHSCERLLRRSPLPYVLDLEHADLFVLYQQASLNRPWARAIIERALLDDKLRFLLPWSDAARRSVFTVVGPDVAAKIEHKLHVVSPAIRAHVERPRPRPDGPLRVLFVGTHFYEKGGVEAFEAIREVRKTHDVTLEIVTYAPPEYAARMEAEPGVTLHAPGGADFIQELYGRADVMLFPSHMDTFGYVVMEAMSHALPVVAPRHLALTETIHDEVSGLLYRPEHMLWGPDTRCMFPHIIPAPPSYIEHLKRPSAQLVSDIAATLARLESDRELHARLAHGALEAVTTGHLSVPRRQALLGALYDAAARDEAPRFV